MQTPQAKLGPGLGWGIQESMPGHMGPVLTHSGSDGTWYAIVALFPQTQSGILIVANAGKGMGGDTAVIKALKAVGPSVSPAKR
jgi:hypothetical protein